MILIELQNILYDLKKQKFRLKNCCERREKRGNKKKAKMSHHSSANNNEKTTEPITREEWQTRLESFEFKQTDMNKLIMDYLVTGE